MFFIIQFTIRKVSLHTSKVKEYNRPYKHSSILNNVSIIVGMQTSIMDRDGGSKVTKLVLFLIGERMLLLRKQKKI